MFLREANDGDVIIAQGDDGDNFYILDQGTVEVFIESSDGEKKLVKTCEAGDSFGELAIMYNAPRAASCVAKGDVRLWALDRVSFNVVLVRTTKAKRKAMTDVLLKIPVFSQLTEYELMTIADTLQEETFEDKAVVCSQGDRGDHFFLVQEGTAVCTISQDDGTSIEVARLTSGSYFGEIALLTTKPRQATVTALQDSMAAAITKVSVGVEASRKAIKDSFDELDVKKAELGSLSIDFVEIFSEVDDPSMTAHLKETATAMTKLRRKIEALQKTLKDCSDAVDILEANLGILSNDWHRLNSLLSSNPFHLSESVIQTMLKHCNTMCAPRAGQPTSN